MIYYAKCSGNTKYLFFYSVLNPCFCTWIWWTKLNTQVFSKSVIFSAFRVSRNHCLFINTNSLRSLPPIVNLSFWKFFWYFDYFLYLVRIYSLCDKIPDKSSIASLASIYKILFVFTNNFYREFLHLVAKISKMWYNIEKLLYTLTHHGLNQYTNH